MKTLRRHSMPRIAGWLSIGLLAIVAPSGSYAAPALVKDINPADAFPDRLADLNGLLLFVADDGRADFPLDLVKRINAGKREIPRKIQPWRRRSGVGAPVEKRQGNN